MPDEKASTSALGVGKETETHAPSVTEAERPPRSRARVSGRKRMIFALAALVVVVAGFFLWRYLSSYESTDDAQVDVHLYPVSSRISGYVLKVNVGDNEYVQKGAVLVEIDPRDYEVALTQARANLANA